MDRRIESIIPDPDLVERPPLLHQQFNLWNKRQQAVCVRHVFKQYGSKKKPNPTLTDLNMTVGKGTIYGLLGASGCGKTTLLSCIVGRRRPNTGEVWVLGGTPGTNGSGVPGKRIGYMPQETALYQEFTIKETMRYFGWIYGMKTSEILERIQFILTLLDLPSQDHVVMNLSGGQQRRVSFALALIHDPELLILDEPTVGVDPLLRQNIWNHLLQITKDGNKTVIMTTHYIEEARQAHTIGLMRSGKLLAEESPNALLSMYGCQSLEEVFLKLSRRQEQLGDQDANISNNINLVSINWANKDSISGSEESGVVGLNFHQSKEILIADGTNGHIELSKASPSKTSLFQFDCTNCFDSTSLGRIKALMHKNFLRLWHNPGVLFFIMVLPVIQVVLFCLSVGPDPVGLKLAIVNHEKNFTNQTFQECSYDPGCELEHFSCRYLSHLKNTTIVKKYFPDTESAIAAVRKGEAWGVVYFTENFTDALVARMALGRNADNYTLKQSVVNVRLDKSNQQIGLILQRDLLLAYQAFTKDLLTACDENTEQAEIPVSFNEPIYGASEPIFTDFVAPGVITTIVFFLAVALTAGALIMERVEGLFDRSLVAGVTTGEILFGHITIQFVVMCCQTLLALISMFCIFNVTCEGSMVQLVFLTILQGLCGMCFGFVISAICDQEREAMQFSMGTFFPMMIISGVIWPIEGMPLVLRYIATVLPLTQSTAALRSMMSRGWLMDEPTVYYGFLSTGLWIVAFLVISMVALKFKKGEGLEMDKKIEIVVPDPDLVESPALLHQQSTLWNKREQAVCVRHVFKQYGSKKKPNPVLTNFNMTAAKGTIYGLLGASGCGKTTLLSCIVGRRRPNTGEVWVLGGTPGANGSGVPGKRIGYMPQETALYQEFTIKETMRYFGWIYGMKTPEILERIQFILTLLDLPSQDHVVMHLSGGQQRRVSFALALIHDPELLILDEPTVGVDPLLRQNIWDHLLQITRDGNKTVIMTTHYIEEARQAHTIGLMRSGKLLAEESPGVLLSMYGCQSLEEVFLKLSRKQGQLGGQDGDITNNISLITMNWRQKDSISADEESGVVGLNFSQSKEMLIADGTNGRNELGKTSSSKTGCFEFDSACLPRIKALMHKNCLRLWHNPGVFFFIMILPVMQVVLFCLAVGPDPVNLKLAIVNREKNFTNQTFQECSYNPGCEFAHFSCRYLSHLKNTTIVKEYFPDKESAIAAVRKGEAWGVAYFTENFTDALLARMALGRNADNDTLRQSVVNVWLDKSNQQIGVTLQKDLMLAYQAFIKDLLTACNQNSEFTKTPISFNEPIYGVSEPIFTDFVAPGIIATIVFFLAVSLTSSALIIDRLEGLFDRSLVAGVTIGEILFSHIITQFVVMCCQTFLVLISMFCIFNVACEGNMLQVVFLTILQGVCGMCLGFVISASCEQEREAIQFAMGAFFPTIIISGVIWPIEGMPLVLRRFATVLPLTQSTTALRSMMSRGWLMDEPTVYYGFLSTGLWIVAFLGISMVVLKFKKG